MIGMLLTKLLAGTVAGHVFQSFNTNAIEVLQFTLIYLYLIMQMLHCSSHTASLTNTNEE